MNYEEQKRSFSPRKMQFSDEEEEFNNRDGGHPSLKQTFGQQNPLNLTGRGT